MPPTESTSPSRPEPRPDHYALLEVEPTATRSDLRQAFRRLSKRYHPDTTRLPQEQARESFRQLQQAYAVLSDPISRGRYDQSLLQPLAASARASSAAPVPSAAPTTVVRPVPVRRALSGGEWFALLLLAVALVLSLVLGLGVAWARGVDLVRPPSWTRQPTSPEPAAPPSPSSQPPAPLDGSLPAP